MGEAWGGKQSSDCAGDFATTMLASAVSVEFDPDAAWNERRRVCESSSLIIESKSITAFAQGDRSGLWTCAVAAAVFRFEVP